MKTDTSLLIVDDDDGHRTMLELLLKKWNFNVFSACNGLEALNMCQEKPYDTILMDIRMPEMDGMTALSKIHEYNPAIPIVMMTAHSDIESAVEAVKRGAYDYLTKPLDFDRLKITLGRSLEHAQLKKEMKELREKNQASQLSEIIGKSTAIINLKDLIKTIAPSDATVLIQGKSGTGKEMVACSIHEQSKRKDKAWVAVNCAALSESLLESELFGHEKGAFTGADKRREGRFLQANGGTLFLDEIGEISPLMQVKLLRVLQQKEIQRVGSDETLKVDVRIVAATNKDLQDEIKKGNFREDLYYRLNVLTIYMPSLTERSSDIPILAQHFLEKFAQRNNKNIKGFSPRAMNCLVKYSWPGNVRELENVMERACILLRDEYVDIQELPESISIFDNQTIQTNDSLENFISKAPIQTLENLERNFILKTLERLNDNKSEAAKQLGISRKTLHIKLKNYEMRSTENSSCDNLQNVYETDTNENQE